jgi:RNA polymerase sigma-70 factor (ECF subfamily)
MSRPSVLSPAGSAKANENALKIKKNGALPQNAETAMENLSDIALIQLFREGSESAGRCLCTRYYDMVRQWALRCLRSPEDAQDAAQDVFSKVLAQKAILKYRGNAQLKTWLYRITFNVCQSHWRSKCRRPTFPLYDFLSAETMLRWPDTNNPENSLIRKEEKQHVQLALMAMPPIYRDILKARYFEDVSYHFYARNRGISVHTLRVQLLRGKKRLAEYFEEKSGWGD